MIKLFLCGLLAFLIINIIECQRSYGGEDGDERIFFLKMNKDPLNPNYYLTSMIDTKANHTYNAVIDINASTNWIRSSFTPPQSFNLLDDPCSYEGESNQMNAFIGNGILIEAMSYFDISQKDDCPYQSSLSFGMSHLSDKGLSLMTKLKEYHITQTLCFALSKTNVGGTIYLGNQSGDLYNSREWSLTCHSITTMKKWNCPLEGVIIGDIQSDKAIAKPYIGFIHINDARYYKPMYSTIFVETIHRFIIVPNAFFNHLVSTPFNESIEDGDCFLRKELKVNYLTCKNEVVPSLPQVSFMISQSLITFPIELLFEKMSAEEMRYLIVSKDSQEEWALGNVLLNVFDLTIEYNPRILHLHSRKGSLDRIKIVQELSNTVNRSKGIEMILLFILSLGLMGIASLLISLFLSKDIIAKYSLIKP